jgi:ribosomal protein S12 methylthiotransferase
MTTVGLISLGCAKNLVDSEVMLGSLRKEGLTYVKNPEKADVLIVNTCAFINDAKIESIETIKAAAAKSRGHKQKLIVGGCLAQRYRKELPGLMPQVDAFIGLDQVAQAGRIVAEVIERDRKRVDAPAEYFSGRPAFIPDYATPKIQLTPKHSAYVKIAEGCNHMCAFCVIPHIRGAHRSRDEADIVREVRELVAAGAKEINLVSQDSTYFGMDKWQGEKPKPRSGVDSSKGASLASLLRKLNAIPGDFWIRPLYTHPAHWSEELMDTFAECRKVAKYVDIPLQHASENMLKAMLRKITAAEQTELIGKIRARIPEVVIRSTFIVGFPGETGGDFDELMAFIKASHFERGGVFAYSREEDTLAAKLPNQLHHATKLKRRNMATEALFTEAQAWGDTQVGRRIKVLVEAKGVARTQWDAPEVDGTVEVPKKLKVGEFAEVEVTDAVGYQLFAKLA